IARHGRSGHRSGRCRWLRRVLWPLAAFRRRGPGAQQFLDPATQGQAPGQLTAAKAKALRIGRQLGLIKIWQYRRIETLVGIDLKVAEHSWHGALRRHRREGRGDDGGVFEQWVGRDLEKTILIKGP